MLQGGPLATCSTAHCVLQPPTKQVWGCWQKVVDWSQQEADTRWLHIPQVWPLGVPVEDALPACSCTLLWLTHGSSNPFLLLHAPELLTYHHSTTAFTSSWPPWHFLPAYASAVLLHCSNTLLHPKPTHCLLDSLCHLPFPPRINLWLSSPNSWILESWIIMYILAFANLNSSTREVIGIVSFAIELQRAPLVMFLGTPSHFLRWLLTILSMVSTLVIAMVYTCSSQRRHGRRPDWKHKTLSHAGSPSCSEPLL